MLSFVCVLIFVKESKQIGSAKSSYTIHGWGKMFSDLGPLKLTFVVVTIGFMMSTFRQASNQTLFPLYGNFVLGLSISQIGFALGVAGGFQVLMSFGAGFISDKYGRKKAIVPSQAITGLTAIALIFVNNYTAALLVMVVFGLGTGLASGNLTAITGDIAPPDARGAFIGLQATLIDASQVAGPLVLGALADTTGGFTIPFLTAGIILLASAASIQFLTIETRTYNAVRK